MTINVLNKHIIIILLIIFSLSIDKGKAQVDTSIRTKHKIFLSFSVGVVIPLGESQYYTDNDICSTGNYAGPAGNGFNGKLDFMYLFSKNLECFAATYHLLTKQNLLTSYIYFLHRVQQLHWEKAR